MIKSYYVSNFNQDYHKIFSQLNNVICNEWSILECGFYFTFELKRVLAILDWILPPKNPFHIEVICVQIKQIHCKIGDIKQYTLHTCIEVCVLVFVVLQGKNKLTTHLWVMVQIRLPISTGFHKVERLTHKVSTTPLMLVFFFFLANLFLNFISCMTKLRVWVLCFPYFMDNYDFYLYFSYLHIFQLLVKISTKFKFHCGFVKIGSHDIVPYGYWLAKLRKLVHLLCF